jgi:iron complex outermembrane receptor protein
MLLGTSYREGEAAGFYRRPNQSRHTALYPNGFLPEIHSTINDVSAAAGLRGKIFENWNFDLSNTYGKTDSITIFKNFKCDLKKNLNRI